MILNATDGAAFLVRMTQYPAELNLMIIIGYHSDVGLIAANEGATWCILF